MHIFQHKVIILDSFNIERWALRWWFHITTNQVRCLDKYLTKTGPSRDVGMLLHLEIAVIWMFYRAAIKSHLEEEEEKGKF